MTFEKGPDKQAKITDFASVTLRRSVRLASKSSSPTKEPTVVLGGLASANVQDHSERDSTQPSKEPLVEAIFKDESPIKKPASQLPHEIKSKIVRTRSPPKPAPAVPPPKTPEPFVLPSTFKSASKVTFVESGTLLPLPPIYELVRKSFLALDNQCLIALGRSLNRVVFHHVMESVEQSTGRAFSADVFGKIATVWPEAFQTETTHVVLDGKRVPSLFISTRHASSPKELENRQRQFRTRLFDRVFKEHAAFLESLGITVPDLKKLVNWHPKFDLSSCDIPVVGLLTPPEHQIKLAKPSSISDRITAALDAKDTQLLQSITSQKDTPVGEEKKKLSLLDRVKLKEQRSAEDSMTRQGKDHRKALESLKPLVEPIQMAFLVARRSSLPSSQVHRKLMDFSPTPISVQDIQRRISLMAKAAPDWLILSDVGTDKEYIRIDSSIPLSKVESLIDDHIRRHY